MYRNKGYPNNQNAMPLNSWQQMMMERYWPVFLGWNELPVYIQLVLLLLWAFMVYGLYVLYRLNLVHEQYLRQFASPCSYIS